MSSLAQLRAQISALEGTPGLAAGRLPDTAPLGVAAIDACLPWGGLPAGGLHEIAAERAAAPAAALAFAAFCLGRTARARSGPILWVSLADSLYPPGLAALGVPVERLLRVRPARTADLLWSLEEILRCPAVAGLLGEIEGLDFKAVRRLSLAARASGVPALLLNRGAALAAVLTRWQVASMPSESAVGVGAWRWRLTLAQCRGMAWCDADQAPQWQMEVQKATGTLGPVAHAHGVPVPAAEKMTAARRR